MEKRTTKISRSWGATIGYLVGAIVALGISIALFMTIVEGPFTLGFALIPAIVALILLFMSFGRRWHQHLPYLRRAVERSEYQIQ